MKLYRWLGTTLSSLTFGFLCTTLTATRGIAAERIIFNYPPFGDFDIDTKDLEVFAKQGKITSNFAFYVDRVNAQQLSQLRDLVQTRFQVTPTLISQFFYSPLGETFLKRLGEVFETSSKQNGFYALRSAFILAAADKEGLTVVNVLRKFPSDDVRLNLPLTQELIGELSGLLKKRDTIVAALAQQSTTAALKSQVDFSKQPDLRLPGSFKFEKQTFTLRDQSRISEDTPTKPRTLPVDLYLPQTENALPQSIPVIVISHGVAEDRTSYAYLAEHLVSRGFAVAVLEHPDTNAAKFQNFLAGLAIPPKPDEFINRPLDVKFLLDQLQHDAKLSQLNLQQVGLIGHSLGGYTVLALAGAKINFEQIHQDCSNSKSLNLSILLQCRATDLPLQNYSLQDDRIKAVIAVNPIDSTIFGQSGLSQIQVPVMLVGGSQDIIAPTVPEQIRPFTWLTTKDKYLALIENATHFSTIANVENGGGGVLPVPSGLIGPTPPIARSYLDALSVAFMETHLANRSEYRSYLTPAYAKFISQAPLNLSLIQSLTPEQLQQIASRNK